MGGRDGEWGCIQGADNKGALPKWDLQASIFKNQSVFLS